MTRRRRTYKGARTDACRQVWCLVYGLEVGATITVSQIEQRLRSRGELSRQAVHHALARAEAVGIVQRLRVSPRDLYRIGLRWARRKLPRVLTIEYALLRGATLHGAFTVLRALESGEYLRMSDSGFVARND